MAAHIEATEGMAFMPQLTLPYLAALCADYATKAGVPLRIFTVDEKAENLALHDVDLVLFTAGTSNALETYRVSDALRAKGVTTVIGGIHASSLPNEASQHATAIVVGEAEGSLPLLLRDFTAGTLKDRYDGKLCPDLAGLLVPRWDLARNGDYCPWIVPVQTSRGCRNACHFCSTTRFQGAKRRHRPVTEIVDEIQTLQEKGILTPDKTVFFTDNNIVSDSDHLHGRIDTTYARSLFASIAPLGIHWVGQGEIGAGNDPELVASMAESGCHLLLVGLESINRVNLKKIGKYANNTDYVAPIERLHAHGIGLIGCFIMGLDDDGPGVFDETWRFIRAYIDVPQISLLTPYPGTLLHQRMAAAGRLLTTDWSRYDITSVVMQPQHMSGLALEEAYTDLVNKVYAWPEMLRRALRYATRRTCNGGPGFGFRERFTSILAPNMIYRRLSLINRLVTQDLYGTEWHVPAESQAA